MDNNKIITNEAPETPQNNSLGGGSFNPDLVSVPISPEIPKKKSKNLLLIVSSIVVGIILIAGAVVFFCFPNLFKSEEPSPEKSIPERRVELFAVANNYSVNGGKANSLFEAISEYIDSVSDPKAKKSLQIFSAFLLLHHDYYGSASDALLIAEENDLTEIELCEVYSYKYLLTRAMKDSDSEEIIKNQRNSVCDDLLNDFEYEKQPNEPDYAYFERLFYAGAYEKSISILESSNISEFSKEDQPFAYEILLGHYRTIRDEEKLNNVLEYYYGSLVVPEGGENE